MMEGKEFTVEIFTKALRIYRELPPGEERLIIAALEKINKLAVLCKAELSTRKINLEKKASNE